MRHTTGVKYAWPPFLGTGDRELWIQWRFYQLLFVFEFFWWLSLKSYMGILSSGVYITFITGASCKSASSTDWTLFWSVVLICSKLAIVLCALWYRFTRKTEPEAWHIITVRFKRRLARFPAWTTRWLATELREALSEDICFLYCYSVYIYFGSELKIWQLNLRQNTGVMVWHTVSQKLLFRKIERTILTQDKKF